MSHQFVSLLVSLRFKLINLDWKSPKTLITDEPADSSADGGWRLPLDQVNWNFNQLLNVCVCVCVCVCSATLWLSGPIVAAGPSRRVQDIKQWQSQRRWTRWPLKFRAHRVHLRCPRSALLLFTYFNFWFLFYSHSFLFLYLLSWGEFPPYSWKIRTQILILRATRTANPPSLCQVNATKTCESGAVSRESTCAKHFKIKPHQQSTNTCISITCLVQNAVFHDEMVKNKLRQRIVFHVFMC